jgi:hypothetical protein
MRARFSDWLSPLTAAIPAQVVIALFAISLGAPIIIRESTHMGIGLRDDSYAYISSAEGFLAGEGYGRISGEGIFKPQTSFPPLYSLSLAAAHLAGLDYQPAARLINGITFAATVFFSGILIFRATSSSFLTLLGAAIILASGNLHSAHSWAMSEGLFISLSITSILLTLIALRDTGKTWILVVAALSTGLAVLTRFIGLALVPPAAAAIYLLPRYERGSRIKSAFIFVAISVLPLALLYARNLALTGNFANAPTPGWHPPNLEILLEGAEGVQQWLVPQGSQTEEPARIFMLSVVILAAIILAFIRNVREIRKPDQSVAARERTRAIFLLSFYALSYLLFLLISMSIVHEILRLIPRILAPLLATITILFAIWLKYIWDRPQIRLLAIALGAIVLIVQIQIGVHTVQMLREEGQGFNSIAWRSSPTIEHIKSLQDIPLYTNDIPAIYFLAGRQASIAPVQTTGFTGLPREDYDDELLRMRENMDTKGAILVLIGPSLAVRIDRTYLAELTEGLVLTDEFKDGMIFAFANSP